MLPLSIVILTKNEERNIERCIKPLLKLSNDILIIDNGSIDNTLKIAKDLGAKIHHVEWLGYGNTKNVGNLFATNDWILSVDADEEMNEKLVGEIVQVFSKKMNENNVYTLQRKMVYCDTVLNFGSLSNEYRIRLFNKNNARWNSNSVHEELEFNNPVQVTKLQGYLWHHSFASVQAHENKMKQYAALFYEQKCLENKKISFVKIYFSPIFNFIKNYLFKLGILDGTKGFQYAVVEMKYTFWKYNGVK